MTAKQVDDVLRAEEESRDPGPYACPRDDCDREFGSRHGLRIHLARGHSSSTTSAAKARTCPDCGRRFYSAKGLQMHRDKSGDCGKPPPTDDHSCPDCSFTSRTDVGLERHRRARHGGAVAGAGKVSTKPPRRAAPEPPANGSRTLLAGRRYHVKVDADGMTLEFTDEVAGVRLPEGEVVFASGLTFWASPDVVLEIEELAAP